MGKQIQRPEIGAALTRLTRLTGSYAPELEESILPVINVGELGIVMQPPVRRQASLIHTIAAVALQFPTWRFEVPGSILAVIRKIWIQPSTTSAHFNMFSAASILVPPAGIIRGDFTDGRLSGIDPLSGANLQDPAGFIGAGTQVAPLAAITWRAGVITAFPGTFFDDLGWVVGSGGPDTPGFMEFQYGVLNEQIRFRMEWDEFQVI